MKEKIQVLKTQNVQLSYTKYTNARKRVKLMKERRPCLEISLVPTYIVVFLLSLSQMEALGLTKSKFWAEQIITFWLTQKFIYHLLHHRAWSFMNSINVKKTNLILLAWLSGTYSNFGRQNLVPLCMSLIPQFPHLIGELKMLIS